MSSLDACFCQRGKEKREKGKIFFVVLGLVSTWPALVLLHVTQKKKKNKIKFKT